MMRPFSQLVVLTRRFHWPTYGCEATTSDSLRAGRLGMSARVSAAGESTKVRPARGSQRKGAAKITSRRKGGIDHRRDVNKSRCYGCLASPADEADGGDKLSMLSGAGARCEAVKLHVLWDPSQNGLFCDCPQRQRATDGLPAGI